MTESFIRWNKDLSISEIEYCTTSCAEYRKTVVEKYDLISPIINMLYGKKDWGYYFDFSRYGAFCRIYCNKVSINEIFERGECFLKKKYLELPFELPVFPVLANYPYLPIARDVQATLTDSDDLKNIINWAEHNSFEVCECIKIYYEHKQDSLNIFNNKKLFPNLKRLTLAYLHKHAEKLEVKRVMDQFRLAGSEIELIDDPY